MRPSGESYWFRNCEKPGRVLAVSKKEFPDKKLVEALNSRAHSLDDLLVQLGYGKLQPESVVEALYPDTVVEDGGKKRSQSVHLLD